MAELTTLARPYAKAAFEFAKENNAIDEWEIFLLGASRIVSDEAFAGILHNPAIPFDKKTAVLMDLAQPVQSSPLRQMLDSMDLPKGVDINTLVKPSKANQAWVNFATQLAEYDRLALLPEIAEHYGELKSKELKQVNAYVTSAYPLTQQQRELLQKSLAERESAIVILHEKVDSDLLGGVTIKVGDKFTDGSVRGRLTQLKTQLC